MTDERLLPFDLDAEAAVLAAALIDVHAYGAIAHKLTPARFYSEANRRIWEAIADLDARGEKIDVVTVAGWLRDRNRLTAVGGSPYLAQLCDATPAVAHVEQHAQRVIGLARLRELISQCSQIRAEAYSAQADPQAFIDGAEQAMYRIAHTDDSRDAVPLGQAATESWEQIVRASNRRGAPELPTGLNRLDNLLALQRQECTTVAARPGMGKTSFVLNIAANLAQRGEPCIVFELEMPREQLATRMACSRAGIDLRRARQGHVHRDEWAALTEATDFLTRLPIWIDDTSGPSALHIRASARAIKARRGLSLVVVDYLQLMSGIDDRDRESREQEISTNMRAMKRLARELDVCVIVLSQLNREVEKRPDKRPMLSDLRDSGAIEQDSDNVLFIYRPEYYEKEKTREEDRGVAELILAKQRNGPTGTVRVAFDPPTVTFSNIEHPEPEPQESFDWNQEDHPA